MKYILSIFIFFISTFAFAEIDKETLNNIYNQLREIDYSYESHIDIPYDLNGENKHVNRRLSQSEQDKYYKDPLVYMTKQAQTDWQRALEMSMYYQGWKPNTIFYRFDLIMKFNTFNEIPTTDDMRFKTREILDKSKSLSWAEKAFELAKQYINSTEEQNWEYINIAFNNLLYRYDESDLENKTEKIVELINEAEELGLDFYFSHNKSLLTEFGSIRADTNLVGKKFALETFAGRCVWRNYFTGFIYPKNRDFAITLISIGKSDTGYYEYLSLYKLSLGLYDKDLYNKRASDRLKKYEFVRRRALIKEQIKEWTKSLWYPNGIISPLMRCSIENYRLSAFLSLSELKCKNPYYNKEKAFKELERLLQNYKPSRFDKPISDFVCCAPKNGIEESLYNEILEEIYKDSSFNYLKEIEQSAREWYSGRIPDAYDYR